MCVFLCRGREISDFYFFPGKSAIEILSNNGTGAWLKVRILEFYVGNIHKKIHF